jgi:hypothetical protein
MKFVIFVLVLIFAQTAFADDYLKARCTNSCHAQSSSDVSRYSAMPTCGIGAKRDLPSGVAQTELRPEPSYFIGRAGKATEEVSSVFLKAGVLAFNSPSTNAARFTSIAMPKLSVRSAEVPINGASGSKSRTGPCLPGRMPSGHEMCTSIASMDETVRQLVSYLNKLLRLSSSQKHYARHMAFLWMSQEMGAKSPQVFFRPRRFERTGVFSAICT